jgi:protein TonB
MFEDSLVESTGSIRTHSRRYAIGSFALQAAFLATLVLIPYIYPDALPRQALSTWLVAPPPPAAPAPRIQHAPATHITAPTELSGLTAPRTIPNRITEEDNASATPPGLNFDATGPGKENVIGAIALLGSIPPTPTVTRPKPSGPVRVSAGVAAGRLLAPIQLVYPAIAKSARIQGTVVIEALISKQGLIEEAHVVSGHPMLAQAALQAVNRARYQPYMLNGQPVEVETTIYIVFSLNE